MTSHFVINVFYKKYIMLKINIYATITKIKEIKKVKHTIKNSHNSIFIQFISKRQYLNIIYPY